MIRAIARVRGLPVALVACAYAAAVLTLTWLTQDGHLGDAMYGVLSMVVMAFPLSIVGDSVYDAVIGRRHDDPSYGRQYVEMGWPGIAMALVLVLLLTWRRTRLAGQVAGWALTAVVLLTGVGMVFGWAPRRPYGWPFLVYGLIMAIGLIAVRRSAPKDTGTEKA
ncbi:hypothetical protein [Planomonospora venezuelensis]|uniref:Uncharacterized protein n=1 Tax=Planomonospora venezuelensis TaxID=1999 RepID=A0A841DGE5_PLAVE|nr:hypothetical protein [Planomonospora venezuelensis]MBB5967165.1 hypothetical protein [Planomonospora venezuelensis]GIN02933.1 hypothetical protein Pve01_45910 [Planomonospora venezuelensis]